MMVQATEYHLHAREWGDSTKPPLLFLHGFLGSGEDWSTIAEELSTDFYVLAPDIPGHGKTTTVKTENITEVFSMPHVASAIVEILTALHIEKTYLCGYSMGGRVALYLALRFPEHVPSALLLSATAGLRTEEERQLRQESDERLAQRLEHEPFEQFLTFWYEQPLFASLRGHPSFAEIARKRKNGQPEGAAASLRGMGTGAQESLWGYLANNDVPLTFAAGALDTKFTALAEELHQHAPQSTLHIIPNAGHALHYESTEQVVKLCQDFLSHDISHNLSHKQSQINGNTNNH